MFKFFKQTFIVLQEYYVLIINPKMGNLSSITYLCNTKEDVLKACDSE